MKVLNRDRIARKQVDVGCVGCARVRFLKVKVPRDERFPGTKKTRGTRNVVCVQCMRVCLSRVPEYSRGLRSHDINVLYFVDNRTYYFYNELADSDVYDVDYE